MDLCYHNCSHVINVTDLTWSLVLASSERRLISTSSLSRKASIVCFSRSLAAVKSVCTDCKLENNKQLYYSKQRKTMLAYCILPCYELLAYTETLIKYNNAGDVTLCQPWSTSVVHHIIHCILIFLQHMTIFVLLYRSWDHGYTTLIN